jgi:hypothetical protein
MTSTTHFTSTLQGFRVMLEVVLGWMLGVRAYEADSDARG